MLSVIIVVVGNGICKLGSNPGQKCLHFISYKYPYMCGHQGWMAQDLQLFLCFLYLIVTLLVFSKGGNIEGCQVP